MAAGAPDTRTTTLFALTVVKDKFHMRLKTSKEKYPVVSGFDKDEEGGAGEVEASGIVVQGDFLKSVNGIRSATACLLAVPVVIVTLAARTASLMS